jgi:hypothetical protein
MNERIQQALDGDFDRRRLSAAEQDELRRAESDINAVVRSISVDPLPDLAPAVLARIHRQALQRRRLVVVQEAEPPKSSTPSLLTWLWRPRPITIGWRPAYALAATVLIAVIVASQALRPAGTPNETTPRVFTRFILQVPNATSVSLAGDFTGWQPAFTMTRSGPELWTVVVPLEPGVHTYAFVIDGTRWMADPMAPGVDDGFGGTNSRVAVLTPDVRKL